MKAISTIIATLLMLIITIGMASLAYSYISGVFTARTVKTIEITDTGCRAGVATNGYYVSIKNLDMTTPITIAKDLTARVNGTTVTIANCAGDISAGGTTNCDLATSGATAGTFNKIKIIGPSNADEKSVTC